MTKRVSSEIPILEPRKVEVKPKTEDDIALEKFIQVARKIDYASKIFVPILVAALCGFGVNRIKHGDINTGINEIVIGVTVAVLFYMLHRSYKAMEGSLNMSRSVQLINKKGLSNFNNCICVSDINGGVCPGYMR